MYRAKIHLLAEQDHNNEKRSMIELAILAGLRKENKILGVSFEIDSDYQKVFDSMHDTKNKIDYSSFGYNAFIIESILRNNEPLLASDNRKGSDMQKELDLEELLCSISTRKRDIYPKTKKYNELDAEEEAVIKELRTVEKSNISMRDDYATKRMDSFLKSRYPEEKDGVLVHFCGLSHVPGLKKRLNKMGYSVDVTVIPYSDKVDPMDFSESNTAFVEGSLLEAPVEMIVHGVAEGKKENMSTGIAKEINLTWPGSYHRFKAYRNSHSFKAGDVWVDELNVPMIAYVATQPDLTHAEIGYVDKGLRNLKKIICDKNISSVGLPRIGCGYGKLKWDEVMPIIEKNLSGIDSLVIIYEKK